MSGIKDEETNAAMQRAIALAGELKKLLIFGNL